MNTQGLLALAQLILPSEILSNFEVVRVEEESSLIRIYLDESVRAEYKENPKIESKGFCDAVTIRDFPIRDKGVDLIVRRRKWYDRQTNRYFSDSYDLKAEGTRYSKEFAAFLKGVYPDFVLASPKKLRQRVLLFSDALPSALFGCKPPCSEAA